MARLPFLWGVERVWTGPVLDFARLSGGMTLSQDHCDQTWRYIDQWPHPILHQQLREENGPFDIPGPSNRSPPLRPPSGHPQAPSSHRRPVESGSGRC